MKVKLDENLGNRGADILRAAGHDVTTVVKEGLSSASDDGLIEVCRSERRCLVTLGLDFGNPLHFEPSRYSGVAVLRLPPKSMASDLFDAILHIDGAVVGPLIGAAVTVSVDHDGNPQERRTRRAGTTGYGEVV